MEYEKVTYDNKDYGIIKINDKKVLLNWDDFRVIYCLDKKWLLNENNDVVTYYDDHDDHDDRDVQDDQDRRQNISTRYYNGISAKLSTPN